jgi:hypothetical protein
MLFADGFRVPCLVISQNFAASHSENEMINLATKEQCDLLIVSTWNVEIALLSATCYFVGRFGGILPRLLLIIVV